LFDRLRSFVFSYYVVVNTGLLVLVAYVASLVLSLRLYLLVLLVRLWNRQYCIVLPIVKLVSDNAVVVLYRFSDTDSLSTSVYI